MTNSSFYTKFILALSAIVLISCDKDFNQLESDIIDDDIHSDLIKQEVAVVAHDRPIGNVQTNNETLNQLGVYDNPVFGKTVSNFVTQIKFSNNNQNPTLFEPVVDTVYLYVPYYSTAKSTATVSGETSTIYELDSIYGAQDAAFNLEVYENGYYLRDADPAAADGVQRYFSGDRAMVESLKVGSKLNSSSDVTENTQFKFSPLEIVRSWKRDNGTLKTLERKTPGIYLNLDKTVIQQKIFNTDPANRLNNNVFTNYFRGLYFKVEQTGKGVMTMPQFQKGVITIKYRDYPITTDKLGNVIADKTKDKEVKTLSFDLAGNRINFFDTTYDPTYVTAINTTSASPNGDERLYVKGGSGSMAVIDIDNATIAGLKAQKNLLINEANLVFYVDDNTTNGMGKTVAGDQAIEPFRLYLYDLKNNQPIYDYYTDASSSASFPKYNKAALDGISDKTLTKRGTRYKIRLTNYISQIVRGDSLNVKLGLVVTENINLATSNKLQTPYNEGDIEVKWTPTGSVLHPFGTVLHGSNAADEKKRLKLEIYYTKPN